MVWPNLFIVGQAKAGTTSLAIQLAQHPDVYLPSVKEPHYMCKQEGGAWYYYHQPLIYNESKYLGLYKQAREKRFRIDASVHYLRFNSVVHEIRKHVSDARIVIVVRDPSSRIISHYLMDIRDGKHEIGLSAILNGEGIYRDEYVGCSLAYESICSFIETFGPQSVIVVDYEYYEKNNIECVVRILKALGLPDISSIDAVRKNTFKMPKPWAKKIYSYYLVRRMYGTLVPEFIKRRLRGFIHNFNKPRVTIDKDSALMRSLEEDYAMVRVLMKAKVCMVID